MRRQAILALLVFAAAAGPGPAVAAEPAGTRTGKERQGGKAFDEQRVDDCKVPEALRTRPRPAGCPRDGRAGAGPRG